MATHSSFNPKHVAPHGPGDAAASPGRLRRLAATLAEMRRAWRTRRLLAEMDDRLLADIGVGRGEALMEASRAPWDVRAR